MGRHRVEELDRPLGLHDAGMADSAARLRPKYLTPRLLVGHAYNGQCIFIILIEPMMFIWPPQIATYI